jgi:hypothetical protein
MFANYGGRGIVMAPEWKNSFAQFIADMGPCPPIRRMSLDRIDNDGNYEPGNCKWATQKEQMRHTRKNVLIDFAGKTQCLTAWSLELNLNRSTIRRRIDRGLSTAEVLAPTRRSTKSCL